jgi:predicted amidohydrolase
MDNHCYLLFASAIGEHPIVQRSYMGRSAITCDPYFMEAQKLVKRTDPGTEIIARAGRKQELIHGRLHIEELQKSRGKKLPFTGDLKTTLTQGTVANEQVA